MRQTERSGIPIVKTPLQVSNHPVDIGVLIIGLGAMGMRHIQACQHLGFKDISIVDTNPARAEEVARHFQIPRARAFTSSELALAGAEIGAVVVSTTANSHHEYVLQAAECGIPFVLCEKAMAVSIEQCDQMINSCEKGRTQLAINHPSRYLLRIRKVMALLRENELGELRSMNVTAGAIGLAMGVSHILEAFRIITSLPLHQVRFIDDEIALSNPRGEIFSDRGGRLIGENEQGVRLFVDFSGDQGHGITTTYVTDRAQIHVDELNGTIQIVARREGDFKLPATRYGTTPVTQSMKVPKDDLILATQQLWLDLLSDGDFPTGQQGRTVVQQLVACEVSAEMGGVPISVNSLSNDKRCFAWA